MLAPSWKKKPDTPGARIGYPGLHPGVGNVSLAGADTHARTCTYYTHTHTHMHTQSYR